MVEDGGNIYVGGLFFLGTTVMYGIDNGFNGIGSLTWSPTMTGFLALVPLLLFSLVGFEVPSQAGDEMENGGFWRSSQHVPVASRIARPCRA